MAGDKRHMPPEQQILMPCVRNLYGNSQSSLGGGPRGEPRGSGIRVGTGRCGFPGTPKETLPAPPPGVLRGEDAQEGLDVAGRALG